MSAYMVNDTTINKVVTFLANDQATLPYFTQRWGIELNGPQSRRDLGEKMFKLNIDAVDARYGEGEAESFRPLNYRFKLEISGGRIPALKALRCLLYQCSEGDVPETQLYKALDWLSDHWAHEIVRNLKAYEDAPWD